jgi:DNA-binding protein Fis
MDLTATHSREAQEPVKAPEPAPATPLTLTLSDVLATFQANLQAVTFPIEARELARDLERIVLEEALGRTSGNRNRAAALLGLNRTTLVEKLKRL